MEVYKAPKFIAKSKCMCHVVSIETMYVAVASK